MSSINSTLDKINALFKKKVGTSNSASNVGQSKQNQNQLGQKQDNEQSGYDGQNKQGQQFQVTDIDVVPGENNQGEYGNYELEEEKIIPFSGQIVEGQDVGYQTVNNDLIKKKVSRIAMASKTQKRPDSMKTKRQLLQEKEEERMKQKIMRKSAGEVWVDQNMAIWQENDYRVFCGNLGNEVTDDVLSNSFKKYPSFTRARVVRDKRSQKTKGYGFASFLDPQDFLKAMKEMNGKYIGNRPVKLMKSEWEDRSFAEKKEDELGNNFLKKGIKKSKPSTKH